MEILVILVCFLLGYWIVAAAIDRKKSSSAQDEPSTSHQRDDAPDSTDGRKQEQGRAHRDRGNADDSGQSSWYRILGVSENANLEEISKAYKALISQYHPDKVMQLGVEIRELAEMKSKQINSAYDEAIKLRRAQ